MKRSPIYLKYGVTNFASVVQCTPYLVDAHPIAPRRLESTPPTSFSCKQAATSSLLYFTSQIQQDDRTKSPHHGSNWPSRTCHLRRFRPPRVAGQGHGLLEGRWTGHHQDGSQQRGRDSQDSRRSEVGSDSPSLGKTMLIIGPDPMSLSIVSSVSCVDTLLLTWSEALRNASQTRSTKTPTQRELSTSRRVNPSPVSRQRGKSSSSTSPPTTSSLASPAKLPMKPTQRPDLRTSTARPSWTARGLFSAPMLMQGRRGPR